MGKKTTVQAPAPDPMVGAAAATQAQLGVDWLEESKRQFGIANDRQTKLDTVTERVADDALKASATTQQWAAQDRARDIGVFRPLQDDFIKTASEWDSPERQAAVAAEAKADVMTAAAQGQATSARQAAAMGISPTSGRYAGVERAGETATALASAGAQNGARAQVRQQGLALQGEAINLGGGLAVNPAQSMSLGLNAGGQAAGTVAAGNQAARANLGIMEGGYKTAMAGYGTQASILGAQDGRKLSAWNATQQRSGQATAGLMGGLGSLAGAALPFMLSTEDAKEDKRPVEGALDAVMGMPVEEWSYKAGEGDGGRHIGPYAEDFARETGKGDGKTIDIISAIGLTMKATQELAQEVRAMKRGRGLPRQQRAAA